MISEMVKLINGEHYIAVVLVVIMSCILLSRNLVSRRVRQGYLWVTIIACALLVVQDLAECYAQLDPDRRTMRLFTSIAGYSLRPVAVLGFLLVIWPNRLKRWFLWIPAVLNALLYSTALFIPLTFYFNDAYSFQRGPLGWIMFPVCLVYLILVLIMIHIRFRERRTGDIFVLYLCAIGCLGSVVMDVYYAEISIVSVIMISSMTFYLFLRSQDTDHDPLTGLWNRMVFYEDCKKLKDSITAVASIDMNGLKKTNDELGHAAGDRALKMIGGGLRSVVSRKVFAYRIGGDEFALLFNHCEESEVQQTITAFQNEIWRIGMSVAIGYSIKTENNESVEEMIRSSDQHMFEDKRMYYQLHDRRRGR